MLLCRGYTGLQGSILKFWVWDGCGVSGKDKAAPPTSAVYREPGSPVP